MTRKERNSQRERIGGAGAGGGGCSVGGGGLGEFVPAVEVSTAGDQSEAKVHYLWPMECNVYLERIYGTVLFLVVPLCVSPSLF